MLILLVMLLHVGTYTCFRILKTDNFNTVLIVCRTVVEGALLYFQCLVIAVPSGSISAGLVPVAVISCEQLLEICHFKLFIQLL